MRIPKINWIQVGAALACASPCGAFFAPDGAIYGPDGATIAPPADEGARHQAHAAARESGDARSRSRASSGRHERGAVYRPRTV